MANLTQAEADGVRVVRLSGSLNQPGVGPLEGEFESATSPGSRVVVDLSGVDMITTTGIAMLVGAAQRLDRSAGRMVLTGARGYVQETLRRCRLDAVLKMVDPADAAAQSARA